MRKYIILTHKTSRPRKNSYIGTWKNVAICKNYKKERS